MPDLFSDSVAWEWTRQEPWDYSASFHVEDVRYSCNFLKDAEVTEDIWDWSLTALDGEKGVFGITGTGHAFAVFSALLSILHAFVNKESPEEVYFTAAKGERSRIHLYDHFTRLLHAQFPAYEGEVVTEGVYRLRRAQPAP